MKIKKLLLLSTVFAAVLFMSFISNDENIGYEVGDVATDFSLKDVSGEMVSLSDYTDAKGFIIIFSCNTCPYVVAYEDRMNELDKKYKSQGFPVIAINPNDPELSPGDSFKNMQLRAREKSFTFPYVLDEKQEIFPQYGATRTPHVYLLEKTNEGNMVRYIGAIDDNYKDAAAVKEKFLENAVDALLEGKEIIQTNTKAIGCSIKFKA